MRLTQHIPNALTMGNLICGCLGIISIFISPEYPVAYFVWAACVFDFLDGFSARALRVSGPLGKQLDSLADMVTFGVLPSLVMLVEIRNAGGSQGMAYTALLIAVCSALRLGKFNIDERQSDSFIGLPTPANALFLTGLTFLSPPLNAFSDSAIALVLISIVFSLLMVSPIELLALKFKNFRWRDNQFRFTFIILSVLLLGFFKAGAIPLIILLYIALSLIGKAPTKKT